MIVTMMNESPVQFLVRRGRVTTSAFAARFRFDMREANRTLRGLEREGLVKSTIGELGDPKNERVWSATN